MDQNNNQGYPPPPGQGPNNQQGYTHVPNYNQAGNISQQGFNPNNQPNYQQQPNYNQQPNYSQQQPKKKNKFLVGCLGCLGVLVIFAIIMGIIGFFVVNKGNKEFDPIVDSYINNVQAQQYSQAYNTLGDDWKAVQTEADYANFESTVQCALGTFVSKTMGNVEISKEAGYFDMATVEYYMQFSNYDADVIYIFYKYDDGWKLVSVEYNSEVFN